MSFRSCGLINNAALNINGRIDTGEKVLSLCCENIPDKPAMAFQDTPQATLERFLGMRSMVIAQSLKCNNGAEKGAYISGCSKCANYQNASHELSMLISYVNLSMYPAPCQCCCCYCDACKQWSNAPEVKEAYEKLFAILELGKETGIIMDNAVWQVSTGEITIHPYRDRIMKFLRGQRAIFYTNCFLYDEDIGKNLHDNPNSAINLSIDAGTPKTWKKIKGFDNFEDVISNLVKYFKQSAGPGQIALKYIVLPGINDNYEDYISLMEIMKILEVKHLTLSRDTSKKYKLNKSQRDELLGAAAYLLALCNKNGISNDMFTYTLEEQKETVNLANEVLQKGLI